MPSPKANTPVAAPVPLPTWTDAASVATYLTSIVGAILGIVVLLHPGFSETTTVQALIPSVSFVVAGVAQIVNVITHRSVQKAAITAASKNA